jgi:DNA repair protein RadA/Sms
LGRCTSCNAWSSLVEESVEKAPSPHAKAAVFGALSGSRPQPIHQIAGGQVQRKTTGMVELDRVLGGGLVPGSLVLVGGDPGIGKSTLMLQAGDRLSRAGAKVLYVTGEESPGQTKMRFDRVGGGGDNLWLAAETSMERIEAHVKDLAPDVLVVDSVQTLHCAEVQSAPGSVSQLRAVTGRLMGLAKGRGVVTFVVGHVTKDGAIAGPRVLEHMVDTVLYFEGRRGHAFRILRAVKNRFGSTDEIGAFEMTQEGLKDVANPSALFLAERAEGASGSVVAASFEGTRPLLVEVQALVTLAAYGTGRRTAIGVDANRVALLLAVLEKKAGLDVGGCDVYVNLAGGLRLDEPAIDLAIIAALASSHLDRALDPHTVVFGEVGLGGEVRGVVAADARLAEARQLGFERVVLPAQKGGDALKAEGLQLSPVTTVQAALDALF